MPQILMLNHAAWVNKQRIDAKLARDRQQDTRGRTDGPVWKGKRFDELTSDEMAEYQRAV